MDVLIRLLLVLLIGVACGFGVVKLIRIIQDIGAQRIADQLPRQVIDYLRNSENRHPVTESEREMLKSNIKKNLLWDFCGSIIAGLVIGAYTKSAFWGAGIAVIMFVGFATAAVIKNNIRQKRSQNAWTMKAYVHQILPSTHGVRQLYIAYYDLLRITVCVKLVAMSSEECAGITKGSCIDAIFREKRDELEFVTKV